MPEKTARKTWHIREIETGDSIDTIEVNANMSDRQEEKLLRGLLTNMNRDKFYVDTNDQEDSK